ncbi:SurA N-terminal domain-containing protein [Nesterenkonia sandarakina]|uniref:Peptidyl-prolyl cis-trans isomerase SurA n=1 Tax=Nesterenkonia sandarakina TaxID=272918 RepID=A0A7Z0J2W4_9MICC|nr:SurA N-terminal domain-containing protein [Nesterenkonia sandarakina]NYJ16356.1 peptidyl-prolyl cis-trans isomerase SurA [Nesterenkonia sandarakina]
MSKKMMTTGFALAGVLALAACSDAPAADDGDANAQEQSAEAGAESPEAGAEQPEMPEADTSDIPEVVAEVNGEELSGEDFTVLYESQFQQMAMQSQISGEEPDQDQLKEQTLESMIGNELLLQDAEDEGYEASSEEIEAIISDAAENVGMESSEEFIEAYEDQGMDEEQLRQDAESQVLINQVLDDLEVPEPSEDELRELYDEAVAAQEDAPSPEGAEGAEEAEMPSFEEARDDLETQATDEARNEAAVAHVDDLRSDAEVTTNL